MRVLLNDAMSSNGTSFFADFCADNKKEENDLRKIWGILKKHIPNLPEVPETPQGNGVLEFRLTPHYLHIVIQK